MLFLGLIISLIRRYILRVKRLENRAEDLIIPAWLIIVVISGFFLEAARIRENPHGWEVWSFVGWFLKGSLEGLDIRSIYPFLWWGHAILSLGFLVFIPLSKMFHVMGAPVSIYLQNARGLMPVSEPDGFPEHGESLEEEEEEPRAGSNGQLRSLDLSTVAFLDACVRCGRCVDVCPSSGAGEVYRPREFVQALRDWVWKEYSHSGDVRPFGPYGEEEAIRRLWHCTTCRACLEVCPVYGPTYELVMGERAIAIEEGVSVPELLNQTLERLFKYENPWISSKREKQAWIEEGLDVPLLSQVKGRVEFCYFVGCTTSVDPRARGIARSLAKILNASDVSFGILGDKEPCCGDIAKRVGEVGLFEEKKFGCMEVFDRYDVKDIVTSSPHCFYNFNNDYPKGMINPRHYTQLLYELIKSGRLAFKKRLDLTVTYHDPCYLGRHSRIFDEPRFIMSSIPGLSIREMKHNRENSLCCGGGGGRMWQGNELNGTERMSERRAKEAFETGANVIITACPLCLIMMEDAIKTLGYDKKMKVMDLNELVVMAI